MLHVMESKLPFTVRIQPTGERPGPSREEKYETKREALEAIQRLGKLALISKVSRRTWSVRQKPKK